MVRASCLDQWQLWASRLRTASLACSAAGGQGPYYVRVLQGGTTSDVIETLVAGQSQTSYTWDVNVAAGKSVTLSVTDATGQTAYTAQVSLLCRHPCVPRRLTSQFP